jgi:hypothetical protein
MNDIVNKVVARMSAARRNAEALMAPMSTRETSLKLQQERERDAMAAKTEHLRELRLAKEAADREAAGHAPARKPRLKRRRVRSF